MSTVKIKTEPATEPTTAAAAAAVVDVQVKLEPSLSTADIKLEQHASDTETKVELDSEADSDEDEERDIKSEDDDDSDDQDQASAAPKRQRKFICEYIGCISRYTTSSQLRMHQHEHRRQTDINIHGKTYILTRRSLDDRWPCPIPDCEMTLKTVDALRCHLQTHHDNTLKPQQYEQPPTKKTQRKCYLIDVDEFYVHGVLCDYHSTIGVFICYECKSVPECLLTHLQQKHGYDEKLIDNSALPESAVNAAADPNINQHTNNTHLAAAIAQPYQQHHQDIVQGWLCVKFDCGYCGYDVNKKYVHRSKVHQGEQPSTVPALVLRLVYSKTQACSFLITRIDQASSAVTISRNRVNRRRVDYSHNGLNNQDENEYDVDQDETADASNQKKQWKCDYDNCEQFFNSAEQLCKHRREHRLEYTVTVRGNTYTLSRHSLDDRWACPIPDCEITCKAVYTAHKHIQRVHSTSTRQKRANGGERDNQNQQVNKRRQYIVYYLQVDDFYICGTRCGYHTTTGMFICLECRLVPECLLTHLQQKHVYDEKSVDNSALPESAVNASADPNIYQHTSNPYLVSAISQPYQHHHPDIVRGWICVTSDCGYCGYTAINKADHKKSVHQGGQISTVPALVLRLLYAKTHASSFLITRIDQITTSSSRVSRHRLDYGHDGLNAQYEDGDTSQNETADAPNQKRQWKCEYPKCRRLFNSAAQLSMHRREHKLQVMITVCNNTFTLSRQSADDRWPCPVPGCETTWITVCSNRLHIRNSHSASVKQKRANNEDNNLGQPIIKRKHYAFQYLKVDDFYVNDIRCGYHNAIGVFICQECKLVPECLLTHLQQKHKYNAKSIDNSALPESANINGSDPNINQHTSNPHLASAIREPSLQHHQDIVQGSLCVTSNCGYCCSTKEARIKHRYKAHRCGRLSTVPALVLRLLFAKKQTTCLFITRLDRISSIFSSYNSTNQYSNEHKDDDDGDELVLSDMGDDDDGDELVLSDYSDENDIH